MSITNYLDFLEAHYECEGIAGLIDSVASLDFTEQGAVAEVTDGLIGKARGPCSGNYPTTGIGFTRAVSGGGVFDTRISQFPSLRFSVTAWFRLDNNTNDQELMAQAVSGSANSTKQWMLRPVWQGVGDTANDDISAFFIWDHVANVFRTGAAVRGSSGAFPTGVWIFIGAAVDIVALKTRLFLGVPGEGTYQDERSIDVAWDAFEATAFDLITLGLGGGHSFGGIEGDIDHVDWYRGYAFDFGDFSNHYNLGNGRIYPDQYNLLAPGGKHGAKNFLTLRGY